MGTLALCDRRNFLVFCGMAAGGFLVGCRHRELRSGLDAYIEEKMERSHIPGLAAAVIEQGEVAGMAGLILNAELR